MLTVYHTGQHNTVAHVAFVMVSAPLRGWTKFITPTTGRYSEHARSHDGGHHPRLRRPQDVVKIYDGMPSLAAMYQQHLQLQ